VASAIGVGTYIGDYRIVGLLGTGGMGAVYRAEYTPTGEPVALKILSKSLAENEEFRQRFLREYRYAAELDHPNIVRVREAGEADGHVFMAQQVVEGTDLEALLAVEGVPDVTRALSILGQVARALDAVHDAGLVHRDIKPANVLVAGEPPHEQAFLTDFGLSKHPTRESRVLTASGDFVGNFYYAAPEQVLGKDIGPEVDVYALGCVLYECLIGEPPFQRGRAVELLEAHIEDPAPQVTAKRPDLPPAIDEVVGRAMAKSATARYPRATELIDAAAQALRVSVDGRAPAQLRLLVVAGPAAGEHIEVDDALEIGRLATGPGSFAGDPELSRQHARIARTGSVYVIEDQGSTNGTTVNGRVVTESQPLATGDTIDVGSTTLLVVGFDALAEPVAREASAAPERSPAEQLPSEPAQQSSPAAPGDAAPQPPRRVELRVDIDFAAGEVTISLPEGADSVRLVRDPHP
jgi:pSer/pThr/pTyr-binding forkhead associated (FHA) protein